MTYLSDLVDKINATSTALTASDLYVLAKTLTDAKVTTVPVTFARAIKARFLNPATTDANELAYLLKTMNFMNVSALQGFWKAPASSNIVTIGNVPISPVAVTNDIVMPSQTIVLSNPGSYNFNGLYSNSIPAWYTDNTLVRFRSWGPAGGGGGGYNLAATCGGGGGGAGGYAEALIPYATIKANPIMLVGTGGAGGGTGVRGYNGTTTSVCSGAITLPGGQGGAVAVTRSPNYVTVDDGDGGTYQEQQGWNANGSQGGAAGYAVLGNLNVPYSYLASGGIGGAAWVAANTTTTTPAGGGASAGGPWGNGFVGGGVWFPANALADTGGPAGAGIGAAGGIPSVGAPAGITGGISVAYLTEWMSAFLQANLGGTPFASFADATIRTSGFGAGGAGAYYHANHLYAAGNGGIFAGGGAASAGITNVGQRNGGNGGVAGGGGGGILGGAGGSGGNGLILIDFFV